MKSAMFQYTKAIILSLAVTTRLYAQDTDVVAPDNSPVKNTFESATIMDNSTVIVPIKGTLEFDIQHRMGLINSGERDFLGIFGQANIRLGFGYVPVNRLMIGFGVTKNYFTWDFNAKYAILRQTKSGSMPVSLTYFGNAAIDSRDSSNFLYPAELVFSDRVSYFNQLLLARKFSDKLSVQVAGSISHYNTVDAYKNDEGETVDKWNNDHLAVAVTARYNVTPAMNVMVNYDQPLTTHEDIDPQPNLSFGVEFVTSSHRFQFFAGNYKDIVPQRNNVFNKNELGDLLLGFNIVRLWNF